MPQYEDGAYDSATTAPTAVERRLYSHRLAQPGPPVREAMLDLARATFAPNVLAGMTEQDLERWMTKRLERPQFANDRPLNYRRSDPYVPDLGFHVAVDSCSRQGRVSSYSFRGACIRIRIRFVYSLSTLRRVFYLEVYAWVYRRSSVVWAVKETSEGGFQKIRRAFAVTDRWFLCEWARPTLVSG